MPTMNRMAMGGLAGCVVALALLEASPGAQVRVFRGYVTDEVNEQRQWEDKFRAVPSPDRLREYMRHITEEPHHAGSPGSRKVAEYILDKFKSFGLNAWIEEHEALMPVPTERLVELVSPQPYRLKLDEPRIAEDKDSGDAGQLPVYNAYSGDGDVTGDLVYVNYGTPDDYLELDRLGISVKGKIVIARYGRSWRGIKPKVAWEHGAIGCLIYSDPRDDGFFQGDVYPNGPFRPPLGAQRGSVMDMPVHPGDPLSPGWGSEKGSKRLERSEAQTILKIPVLPISYADAEPLLKQLSGPVAREDWRGALPLTYHIGPGPARVHIKLAFDWQTRPLYNVVARIDGTDFPNEWLVHGNHHDAWVNGADDPTSGAVAVIETARGLGELVKAGWKPKRTIVLALWDGEEWGLLGSTEWGEKHAAELSDKAIMYVNSDSSGKGWLGAGGSHSLQTFLSDVLRDVKGPRGSGTVLDEARARLIDQAKTDEEKARLDSIKELPLEPLGSGSDYTVFLDHLTVASLNLGFGGESSGGIYHSIYDSFDWYTRFSDGTFQFGAALSQVNGSTLMRMADANVVPFQFTNYATTIKTYVDELAAELKKHPKAPALDLSAVNGSVEQLSRSAEHFERAMSSLAGVSRAQLASKRSQLVSINRLVYTTERLLGHAAGLPKRGWFKHLVYAPGYYTGYGVKTLPGIREGLEQEAWAEAQTYAPLVAQAIARLASQVDRAATELEGVVGK